MSTFNPGDRVLHTSGKRGTVVRTVGTRVTVRMGGWRASVVDATNLTIIETKES